MSKKTRKKSPKASSGKPARAPSKASAKSPPSKTTRATTGKSGGNAKKPVANARARASHKASSKQLKLQRPEAPAAGRSGLTEGARAPAFRLPRDGGETVVISRGDFLPPMMLKLTESPRIDLTHRCVLIFSLWESLAAARYVTELGDIIAR